VSDTDVIRNVNGATAGVWRSKDSTSRGPIRKSAAGSRKEMHVRRRTVWSTVTVAVSSCHSLGPP